MSVITSALGRAPFELEVRTPRWSSSCESAALRGRICAKWRGGTVSGSEDPTSTSTPKYGNWQPRSRLSSRSAGEGVGRSIQGRPQDHLQPYESPARPAANSAGNSFGYL